jgi:hypothetical protein
LHALQPAPPALVSILNDAYQSQAGRLLVDGQPHPDTPRIDDVAKELEAFKKLVARTYWTEAALSAIVESIRHPVRPSRQIILAGPPGTSKTLGHASLTTTGRYLHARPEKSSGDYLAV